MENITNTLPYKFEKTEFNCHFKFKRNDITITGHLPHINNKSASCIVAYETKKEFFGINLNSTHFDRFLDEPIEKVLNGVPMHHEFEGTVFVNFENFFGHFSKENFQSIIEGLTYITKLYNECKLKVQ
ncbi:hypothetical protein [uncultured Aquimarina sp.]|uniref:hypothetical protein n=1 Tax=uncultured Aquimarina sp. TaxID=575652 RepID=UPI00260295BA|nr:hypothetical protein [uncultured Aquimarina sp.]